MTTLTGKIQGPLVISSGETKLQGQVVGDVIVEAGGSLVCQGQVTGDLRVRPTGRASVPGMVVGTVFNEGGVVRVAGIVGAVVDTGSTLTTLAPKAVVRS